VEDLRSKCSASLRLKFPSEKEAQIFWSALKPETESPATPRSRVRIELRGSTLFLFFEADDTNALRASLNSYLSWLNLLKNLHENLRSFESP